MAVVHCRPSIRPTRTGILVLTVITLFSKDNDNDDDNDDNSNKNYNRIFCEPV